MEKAILVKIEEIRNTKDTHTRCINFWKNGLKNTGRQKSSWLNVERIKTHEKELTTAKKEISAQIKDINNKARMENAQVSTEYFSSAKSKQLQKFKLEWTKKIHFFLSKTKKPQWTNR